MAPKYNPSDEEDLVLTSEASDVESVESDYVPPGMAPPLGGYGDPDLAAAGGGAGDNVVFVPVAGRIDHGNGFSSVYVSSNKHVPSGSAGLPDVFIKLDNSWFDRKAMLRREPCPSGIAGMVRKLRSLGPGGRGRFIISMALHWPLGLACALEQLHDEKLESRAIMRRAGCRRARRAQLATESAAQREQRLSDRRKKRKDAAKKKKENKDDAEKTED